MDNSVHTGCADKWCNSFRLDVALAVGIRGEGELIDEGGGKRAGEARGADAVGTRPDFFHSSKGVLEGSVEMPGRVGSANGQPLGQIDQVIHFEGILAQIRVGRLSADPIGSALQEARHRLWKYG